MPPQTTIFRFTVDDAAADAMPSNPSFGMAPEVWSVTLVAAERCFVNLFLVYKRNTSTSRSIAKDSHTMRELESSTDQLRHRPIQICG